MKITVLINNYNYEQYVGQAIESALAQSHPDVEVVVLDDGSTDGSRNIIRSYGDRICAVFKANGGQGSAFNTGVAHSRGAIIMLLDSDDFLRPDAAAKIAAHWTPETGALHHRLLIVDNSGTELGYDPPKPQLMDSGDVVPILLNHGGRYNLPPTSGMAISRKILEAALPIPEEEFRICADLYLRVVVPFLTPISVLDETLACRRFHPANLYVTNRGRSITRERLLMRDHYSDLAWKLTRDMAAKRNLIVPDSTSHRTSQELFDRLLIALSGSGRVSMSVRITNARDLAKAKIRALPIIYQRRAPNADFDHRLLCAEIGSGSHVSRLVQDLIRVPRRSS